MDDTPQVQRRLHSVEQAAQSLGCSRATIYELISAGRLRSVKIGKLRRVPDEALDEFVRALASAS